MEASRQQNQVGGVRFGQIMVWWEKPSPSGDLELNLESMVRTVMDGKRRSRQREPASKGRV